MLPELLIVALSVVWIVVKDIQIRQEREAWVDERRELMNRIQHPEVVPLPTEHREIQPREMDEINLVGAVIDE